MKKATVILTALFLVGLLASTASAYNISFTTATDTDGVYTTERTDAYVWDFNNPNDPLGTRPSIFESIDHNDAAVVSGSVSGKYAAPYIFTENSADLTPYLSVPEENSNGTGSFKVSLSQKADYFGMLWGSVDSYNALNFFQNGSLVESLAGNDIVNPANGNQTGNLHNVYVNLTGFEFDQFELVSTSFAFEVDNIAVAPVPEPGTFVLMGLGLAGLVGMRKKFRK